MEYSLLVALLKYRQDLQSTGRLDIFTAMIEGISRTCPLFLIAVGPPDMFVHVCMCVSHTCACVCVFKCVARATFSFFRISSSLSTCNTGSRVTPPPVGRESARGACASCDLLGGVAPQRKGPTHAEGKSPCGRRGRHLKFQGRRVPILVPNVRTALSMLTSLPARPCKCGRGPLVIGGH